MGRVTSSPVFRVFRASAHVTYALFITCFIITCHSSALPSLPPTHLCRPKCGFLVPNGPVDVACGNALYLLYHLRILFCTGVCVLSVPLFSFGAVSFCTTWGVRTRQDVWAHAQKRHRAHVNAWLALSASHEIIHFRPKTHADSVLWKHHRNIYCPRQKEQNP